MLVEQKIWNSKEEPERQTDSFGSLQLIRNLVNYRMSLLKAPFFTMPGRNEASWRWSMKLRGWSNIQQQEYLIDHTQLQHRPSVRGGGDGIGSGGRYLQLLQATEAQLLTEYKHTLKINRWMNEAFANYIWIKVLHWRLFGMTLQGQRISSIWD